MIQEAAAAHSKCVAGSIYFTVNEIEFDGDNIDFIFHATLLPASSACEPSELVRH